MFYTVLDVAPELLDSLLSDRQKLHCSICKLFGTSRKDSDVLFWVHPSTKRIYMQSKIVPDMNSMKGKFILRSLQDISAFQKRIQDGVCYSFHVTLPVYIRKATTGNRRYEVRTSEERFAWLKRKGEYHGFRLLSVHEERTANIIAGRPVEKGGMFKILNIYHYNGILQVTDSNRFKDAQKNGVGIGKAYGLGMLLLNERGCSKAMVGDYSG